MDNEKRLIKYANNLVIRNKKVKVEYFIKIKDLIENTRVNINYKESGYGETVLMISCGTSYDDDHLPLVQLLLENGANPNIKNSVGDTALTYAAMNNYDIVELLLNNGANPLIKNNDGQTVSDIIYNDTGGVLSIKDTKLLQLLKKYEVIYRIQALQRGKLTRRKLRTSMARRRSTISRLGDRHGLGENIIQMLNSRISRPSHIDMIEETPYNMR